MVTLWKLSGCEYMSIIFKKQNKSTLVVDVARMPVVSFSNFVSVLEASSFKPILKKNVLNIDK